MDKDVDVVVPDMVRMNAVVKVQVTCVGLLFWQR